MFTLRKIYHFAKSTPQSLILALEMLFGLACCFVALLIFVKFTREMMETEFNAFDTQFSLFVYTFRTPMLTSIMKIFTFFGSAMFIGVMSLLNVLFLLRKHKKEALLFCVALVFGVLLNASLKFITHRERPQMSPLVIEKSMSFPSGHAMNSFIFYFLISYFSYHLFRNKLYTAVSVIFCGLLVLCIGISRIYLGVHFLTDVIAGYIGGFWWLVTVLLIDKTLTFYKFFRESK